MNEEAMLSALSALESAYLTARWHKSGMRLESMVHICLAALSLVPDAQAGWDIDNWQNRLTLTRRRMDSLELSRRRMGK